MEFAMTLSMLIIMLGGFFDVGLAVHNWLLLRHVTSESSRQIAVNYATAPYCEKIEQYLREQATPRLRETLGADARGGRVTWMMKWSAPSEEEGADSLTFHTMKITGAFGVNCYFICKLFPDTFRLTASSESVIERQMDKSCPDFTVELP